MDWREGTHYAMIVGGAESQVTTLRYYSKPGCSLCDEAIGLVEELARQAALAVVEVNIEDDPELLERHRHRIPVVELEGEVIAWGRISERALRLALAKRGLLR